jgi:hypothetical protein
MGVMVDAISELNGKLFYPLCEGYLALSPSGSMFHSHGRGSIPHQSRFVPELSQILRDQPGPNRHENWKGAPACSTQLLAI